MADSQGNRLRSLLGDEVPPGGSVSDAFFSSDDISDLLLLANGSIERAAVEGWRRKAASYAELVNVTEGNASREMGQLAQNALAQVKYYERTSSSATSGRTRVGRIVRRGY